MLVSVVMAPLNQPSRPSGRLHRLAARHTGGVTRDLALLALRTRAAVNTLNLSTPVGLAVARLGGASVRRGTRGLFLAEGYRFRFPVAGAFTVGNVVTTASTIAELTRRHPDVLAHEDRHAWQWCVAGPLFLPLYLAGAAWSWVRTGDIAVRNLFERHAGLVSGGYLAAGQPVPRRRRPTGWPGTSGAGPNAPRGGAAAADAGA